MAISKFDNYLCDIEDESKSAVNKLIRKIAKDSYNNGVSDAQIAAGKVDEDAVFNDAEMLAVAIEKAIVDLYVQ